MLLIMSPKAVHAVHACFSHTQEEDTLEPINGFYFQLQASL